MKSSMPRRRGLYIHVQKLTRCHRCRQSEEGAAHHGACLVNNVDQIVQGVRWSGEA
jgi:hypothetical protein